MKIYSNYYNIYVINSHHNVIHGTHYKLIKMIVVISIYSILCNIRDSAINIIISSRTMYGGSAHSVNFTNGVFAR